MKKTALLAAAAAMFSAAPAMAAGGYVGVEHTSSEVTTISYDETDSLDGEFAVGFGGASWGAQIDGSIGTTEYSFVDVETNTFSGHVWYAGDGWRLGGVVTRSELDVFGSEWAYGVEGSFDLGDKAVLFASALDTEHEDIDVDVFNVDMGANYYFTPNLRIGAGYGFGEIESDDIETYSFSGEYQPFSAPISLTLGWSQYDLGGPQSESVSIGARWSFGAATLRERDNITPFSASTGFLSRLQAGN